MPLVGLIDPSHRTRKEDGALGSLPPWFTTDELLEQAAFGDPKWSPWPYELIAAALAEWQERDYISTTMLTGKCPRGTVIERKADFVGSLDMMYAALRGTQVHRTLEGSVRNGAVAEARFHMTVHVPGYGDVPFSCSPDLITADTVWDYKVASEQSGLPNWNDPWPNHAEQLQLNRYVINHAEKWTMNGEPFDMPFDPRTAKFEHLAVVYLGPKYPKTLEVTHKVPVTYKNGNTGNRNFPYVMPDGKVEDTLLMPRIEAMQRALETFPEWPDGVEKLWGGQPGWQCPGPPLCHLPNCMAKRYPHMMTWPQEGVKGSL